eukprot:COSAG02_NODE_1140_length_14275_cov_154.904557_11_plen_69_part_00
MVDGFSVEELRAMLLREDELRRSKEVQLAYGSLCPLCQGNVRWWTPAPTPMVDERNDEREYTQLKLCW